MNMYSTHRIKYLKNDYSYQKEKKKSKKKNDEHIL